MYCLKCGNPMKENEKFCSKCGSPAPQKKAQPVQMPGQQNPQRINPNPPQGTRMHSPQPVPANAQGGMRSDRPVPPKKKKGGIKPLYVVIPVLILAVCILIAGNAFAVQGFFMKTFGGADGYFKYVESKAIMDMAETLADIYDNNGYTELLEDDFGVTAEIGISAGDALLNLLGSGAGIDDLSWLKNASVNMDFDKKDDKTGLELSAKLGKKDVISVQAMLDTEKELIVAGVPELSKTYLGMELSEYLDSYTLDQMRQALDSEMEIPDVLKDTGRMVKLFEKYLDMVSKHIKGVEKDKEVLSIGDVEQKCTTLKLYVTYGMLYDIVDDVVMEAYFDSELKDFLKEVLDFAISVSGEPTSSAQMYDHMMVGLMDFRETMKEYEGSEEIAFILTDYVDGNDIIGRVISADGEEVGYGFTKDGSDYAFTADLGYLEVESEGQIKSGKLTGTVSLNEYDYEMYSVEIADLQLKKLKQGYVDGTFSIPMTEDLLYSMDLEDLSYIGGNMSLTMDVETSAKAVKLVCGLGAKEDDPLVSVTMNSKIRGAGKISMPNMEKEVALVNDEDELLGWVMELDFDTLLKNLRSAGVPEELVGQLEEVISYLALLGMF